MLLEEQVSELLQRCEQILGHDLRHARGSLQEPKSRAAAVWELLVIEAAARLGAVQYEPDPKGCPDIKLALKSRSIWLEATYLYPRYWDEERRTDEVRRWLYTEAQRRNIPLHTISTRFDGRPSPSGFVRELPSLHERLKFLGLQEIQHFFEDIVLNPQNSQTCNLSNYSVAISYTPTATSPFLSSGGLAQEAPKVVSEHALYRKLKGKADQFAVSMPLIICVGGQNSPALSGGRGIGTVSVHEAISAAFSNWPSLSAAIIVSIEYMPVVLGPYGRQARTELVVNQLATYPLTPEETRSLSAINFNTWNYTFEIGKWTPPKARVRQRITGPLIVRSLPMGLEVQIPANIVIEALAGKTSLERAFDLKKDHEIVRALEDGWAIKTCRLIDGDIQAGEDRKLVLELVPSEFSIFGSK